MMTVMNKLVSGASMRVPTVGQRRLIIVGFPRIRGYRKPGYSRLCRMIRASCGSVHPELRTDLIDQSREGPDLRSVSSDWALKFCFEFVPSGGGAVVPVHNNGHKLTDLSSP